MTGPGVGRQEGTRLTATTTPTAKPACRPLHPSLPPFLPVCLPSLLPPDSRLSRPNDLARPLITRPAPVSITPILTRPGVAKLQGRTEIRLPSGWFWVNCKLLCNSVFSLPQRTVYSCVTATGCLSLISISVFITPFKFLGNYAVFSHPGASEGRGGDVTLLSRGFYFIESRVPLPRVARPGISPARRVV